MQELPPSKHASSTRIPKKKNMAHIRFRKGLLRGIQQSREVVLAVLEDEENHLPAPSHGHVQETNATWMGNLLEELYLSEGGQRKPILFFVVENHLGRHYGMGGGEARVP